MGEREDMARQLQELRHLLAQVTEGRRQDENPGDQEEPMAPERVQENARENEEPNGEPAVVNITDQNRHLISDALGGMIVLPGGALRLTPQFITQQKNPNIQRMKVFSNPPTTTPDCVRALDGHPQPSNLNLQWMYEGEWAKIPIERYTRLNKESPYEIVRVQSYIDEQGVIRKAVSYGRSDKQLNVWYRYMDIQQYFPNWEIHRPSLFYNGRNWREQKPFFQNKEKKDQNRENNKKKSKDYSDQEEASGSNNNTYYYYYCSDYCNYSYSYSYS